VSFLIISWSQVRILVGPSYHALLELVDTPFRRGVALPNTDLRIVFLKAPKTVLEARYKDRGSNQSEQFLKGRETKYSNLLSNVDLMPYITVFNNTNLEEQEKVLRFLEGHFKR